MSSAQRLVLLVVAVIVLGGAFLLFSGSDNKDDNAATATTATTTPGAPAATTPVAAPQPKVTTIVVKGGKPDGGVKTIKANKGDRVNIEVTSPDTTSEVHFHGYDIKRDLTAGGKVRFSFDAKLEGIFEMELEETAVQIAKIEISPN